MGEFVKRKPWILPLAFAALLAAVGWSSYRMLAAKMRLELADMLETLVAAEVAALEIWVGENEAVAEVQAADARVRQLVAELVRAAREAEDPRTGLLAAPALRELRALLDPMAERHGYPGYGVLDPSGLFLAARSDRPVGTRPDFEVPVIRGALAGKRVTTPPLLWPGGPEAGDATIVLVGVPIRDEGGRPIAVFGLAIDPEAEFERLLSIARVGRSGETYAFDANGRLVSRSRFDEQLREIGLLPGPHATSFLHIQVRDPGVDLTEGHAPELPLAARPLTRAAASAVSGESGVDVGGYRDYRGVEVAGAWAWLPQIGIGIATEIDVDEAYDSLFVLRRSFARVVGLLVTAALGMLLYSIVVMRLRRQVAEAREIGRYRIERKLGQGGMGTVYLARHALLRRPTAIKILRSENAGQSAAARFEREVQVSSTLTHPNTIEIYDFGYTPEGIFYYAMEYVEGLTLGQCVDEGGPQPEARVVHLMKQASSSIAEAHSAGLIHRDLKPSNIMLCERGGLFDFVKVLDFGLVRSEHQSEDVALTVAGALTGTPLYLPPEAVKDPRALDARGDVYQLGAIAYFLLVGRPVFQGRTAFEVMTQHTRTAPLPPSQALGRSVSPELERIILWCLEKDPGARPRQAGDLLEALRRCEVEGSWGQDEASDWWTRWRERHAGEKTSARAGEGSTPSGYSVDFERRRPSD